LQFASRYPGDPRQLTLHDFLPDEKLREVGNLHDFAGMLVFDKWTCNTNGRQTLFFEQNQPPTKGQPAKGDRFTRFTRPQSARLRFTRPRSFRRGTRP
jgi:hypothetical protein